MGGRSGGPSGQTRTGTQDGDLHGHGGVGSSGGHGGAGSSGGMVVQGAQEAMAGRLRGLGLGPLGPAPTAGTLSTPPKKKFPGEVRGYQKPSGAKQTGQDRDRTIQNKTGKPSRARQTGQDSPQEQEALQGQLGS